jgi:hypothetical protein
MLLSLYLYVGHLELYIHSMFRRILLHRSHWLSDHHHQIELRGISRGFTILENNSLANTQEVFSYNRGLITATISATRNAWMDNAVRVETAAWCIRHCSCQDDRTQKMGFKFAYALKRIFKGRDRSRFRHTKPRLCCRSAVAQPRPGVRCHSSCTQAARSIHNLASTSLNAQATIYADVSLPLQPPMLVHPNKLLHFHPLRLLSL